ncbi:hypothetical protein J4207_01540 [Candidatus Woesearchaeota archaeon]|nr:hypothetical protein [Candidatus Woesearchaeota archaeon]
MRIFEIVDKTGRKIYLTDERWRHINEEHPEMSPYIKEFENVLQNPTKITSYQFDEKIRFFYKRAKERSEYILIVVKYLNGEGYMITAYFVRKIQ